MKPPEETANGNGNGVWFRWVMGIAISGFTAALIFLSSEIHYQTVKVDSLSVNVAALTQKVSDLAADDHVLSSERPSNDFTQQSLVSSVKRIAENLTRLNDEVETQQDWIAAHSYADKAIRELHGGK